jgi:hypothetical protein
MKKLLLVLVLLAIPAHAQPPTVNGQGQAAVTPCRVLHSDAAVNIAVTVTVPAPPSQDQFVYICGWDYTVSEDATGSTQTNVTFTTTNLGNVKSEYSVGTAPNAIVSGNYTYPTPARADVNGQGVVFVSPAAATHNAYSLNVYYRYGF